MVFGVCATSVDQNKNLVKLTFLNIWATDGSTTSHTFDRLPDVESHGFEHGEERPLTLRENLDRGNTALYQLLAKLCHSSELLISW